MERSRKLSENRDGVSRRTFNKIALSTGAALTLDSLIPGCSGSSSSPSPPAAVETKTLHFDLYDHPDDSTHELRVGGQRYSLVTHTPETLQQTRNNNPGLNDERLTHYAADIELNALKPHLLSITTFNRQRGNGLVMVAFHIPSAARAQVRAASMAKAEKPQFAAAGPICSMMDQVPDEFLTGFDTATAIVMHHPEIINLNKEIAAAVEVHIGNSAEVMNLAQSICAQGPAYEKDPEYLDGWAVLVPLYNTDGSAKLDRFGLQIYDYQFSEQTKEDMKGAIKDVLSRIKNDPALKDKMYAVRPHGGTEPVGLAAKLAARYQLWQAGGVELAATNTGYHHNVWFQSPEYTGSGASRSFKLKIVNMNFIWYGVYVEYLDAAGNPIRVPEPGAMFSSLVPYEQELLSWLESDTIKFVGILSSPPTVFGVPVFPYPSEIDIAMPAGASRARVMLCGPGGFGKVDYGPSLTVGIIMTSIFQYALPTYFICKGSGINEEESLWDLFTTSVKLKILLTTCQAVRDTVNPSSTHDAALIGSVQSLLSSLLQQMIVLITNGAMPKITEWIVEKTVEEEAEDAVPFIGWVVRIVTLLGTVADLVTTTAEIASNPLVIENNITFTAPVEVTVNCDIGNFQFPEEANYYEVQFTVSGAPFPSRPKGFPLAQAERGKRTLKLTIDSVPTTGSPTDTVDIWFYSDSGKMWLAAHGRSTFANQPGVDGKISAVITINQNPIPLTATTLYSQHRKLEYLGGKYIWNENPATLADPVIEPTECHAGLCELTNISIWVPGGMLGYSWQSGNQHLVKNVNAQENDPNPGLKLLNSGMGAPTPVAYDKTALYNAANLNGRHFYLDPVNISINAPAYHLRRLSLDPDGGVFKTGESWGKFPMQLDRLAVHPLGYVVGISANNHKMGILQLPAQAYRDDANTNNAVLKLGYGENDQFVKKPQALTISRTGAILILQGDDAMSIKAFDVAGNPWPFFNNASRASFSLVEADAKWLDIAIDDTEMIYVLSYTGTGMLKLDYHLDVYDKSGSRVFRNSGISVARMVVDKWRRIYSLNQETMKNSPLVEPTVSVWMPSTPH